MESDEFTTDGSKTMFHKVALPDYNSKFILGEVYRRKVFFNYEKRLRLRSPPEKLYLVFVRYLMDIVVIYSLLGLHVSSCLQVFEYFAYFQISKGELFMRPVDLMQVVVPIFPSFESHIVRDVKPYERKELCSFESSLHHQISEVRRTCIGAQADISTLEYRQTIEAKRTL
ncbi:hypothetical protein Godav_020733 [Gossypium davidsonii]|uniref:Uncharacterized protein n=1 Tax=Gossypium davidsonii TaxID=34287 RepID=A0A7J8R422_GOSDV|nr:hypothetical protein [Gossypium davidsonii]